MQFCSSSRAVGLKLSDQKLLGFSIATAVRVKSQDTGPVQATVANYLKHGLSNSIYPVCHAGRELTT